MQDQAKKKLTIDLKKTGKTSLYVLIAYLILFGLPFTFLWIGELNVIVFFKSRSPFFPVTGSLIFMTVMVVGIVFHELIHGITWAIFAKKGFKSITFGVLWKQFTPYCHCKEPLALWQYIIGAIMPAIILGIIPSIIALSNGNLFLLIFGFFFTISAVGDFMIINLIKNEKPHSLVEDHPSEPGCYIYL